MNKVSKMLLTDSFEVKGIWYLPGADLDEDGVDGILRYSPQEIVLELIGSFGDAASLPDFGRESQLVIFGFSENGEYLTLFKCIPKNIYIHAPGFDTCSYSISHFYVGTKLIKNEGDKLLSSAEFSFTNLDAWMNFPVINYSSNRKNKKLGCIVDLAPPCDEKKKFEIPSIESILSEEFSCCIEYPKDFFLQETAQIIVNRFYHLAPSAGNLVSPQIMLANIHKLRRLLTLMIGKGIYTTYIDFTLSDTIETLSNGEEYSKKEYCRVFFKQVGDIFAAKHLSPYTPRSILLKRSDVKENLEHIINRWFAEQDKFEECINAYISDLYLPGYMADRFLNIIRGIESYHRFFVEGKSENETAKTPVETTLIKDQRKISDYISKEVLEENRDYFLRRINYVDEMNLRKRLNGLFALTPPELTAKLFGNFPSSRRKKMISTIIDTRNYYTHRDAKKNYRNALDAGPELIILIKQLSVLLQYFSLSQLGIAPGVIIHNLSCMINQIIL